VDGLWDHGMAKQSFAMAERATLEHLNISPKATFPEPHQSKHKKSREGNEECINSQIAYGLASNLR
jgi:hypothetical protein